MDFVRYARRVVGEVVFRKGISNRLDKRKACDRMSKTRSFLEVLIEIYECRQIPNRQAGDANAAQQRFLSLFLRSEREIFRYVAVAGPKRHGRRGYRSADRNGALGEVRRL